MVKETSEVPVLIASPSCLEEGPHTWVLDDQLLTHTHQTFLTLIVCKVCLDLCFADKSITVVIATILYCFEVGKAKNSNEMEIGPTVDFDGLIRFGRES